VDATGKRAIDGTFAGARKFSEGLAAVRVDLSYRCAWGFINRDGEMVIPPTYQEAQCFADGLGPVRSRGKWGMIDHHERVRIPFRFQYLYKFDNNVAKAMRFNYTTVWIHLDGSVVPQSEGDAIGDRAPAGAIPDDSVGDTYDQLVEKLRREGLSFSELELNVREMIAWRGEIVVSALPANLQGGPFKELRVRANGQTRFYFLVRDRNDGDWKVFRNVVFARGMMP
jgi:hypothetical protein